MAWNFQIKISEVNSNIITRGKKGRMKSFENISQPKKSNHLSAIRLVTL
jgi:hypothetical protein